MGFNSAIRVVCMAFFGKKSCNDARIQRGVGWTGGPNPPLKNHKFIKFLRTTSPDLLKSHKATSIQCWAIIGPLAEHHLNGV